MRLLNLVLIISSIVAVAVLVGCGANNEPTNTDNINNPGDTTTDIAGLYSGSETNTSLIPTSHPICQQLSNLVGDRKITTLSIERSGSYLTAQLTYVKSGTYIDYEGIVGEATLDLSGSFNSAAVFAGIMCGDGIARNMIFKSATLTGTLSGTRISGTFSQVFNTSITSTGIADGEVTLRGTFYLVKSSDGESTLAECTYDPLS